MSQLTRRDFLKLASLFAAGTVSTLTARSLQPAEDRPNIIIILFDAMSAKHMSLYEYGRETTPELSRFAERCTVYNTHYSASNFTTSGVASMLTGMYPWKHRALTQGSIVKRDVIPYNPYTLLGSDYYRLMFSQNFWPDRLVAQYYDQVDDFLPQTAYSMRGNTLFKSWVGKDRLLASIAFDEFLFPAQTERPGSAFLNYFYKSRVSHSIETQKIQPGYPNGVPEVEGYNVYRNEQIYKGVLTEILNLRDKHPYFAYFHLFSPHSPYKPGGKFSRFFRNDGFSMPSKEVISQFASLYPESDKALLRKRTVYDRQIAQVDAEFGKLVDQLEANGVLDDSYLIVTSDHGEMFERGFSGHGGRLMYEPLLRTPLLVHAPKQTARSDVNIPTSNVDILPTILAIAGKEIPEIVDGRVLPGFGSTDGKDRSIFSMAAWQNSAFLPITKAAFAMLKSAYKLIVYLGYGGSDGLYELYDIDNDPEELQELSKAIPSVFERLKEEFFVRLAEANRPFERNR